MNQKRLLNMILMIYKRMNEPYYQGVAAELAFFFLLSMVPIAVILGEIMGVFSISIEVLADLVKEYADSEISENLINYLAYKPSGAISAAFVVFALWAASKAQYSLVEEE